MKKKIYIYEMKTIRKILQQLKYEVKTYRQIFTDT